MALILYKTNIALGLYDEPLDSLYARVEPTLDKTGTKILFELYYYKDKDSFQAGGKTIQRGDIYAVDYTVTNDGYVLYGLHQLLKAHLESLTDYEETTITITDVDAPV